MLNSVSEILVSTLATLAGDDDVEVAGEGIASPQSILLLLSEMVALSTRDDVEVVKGYLGSL